jgi:hypothetical protein
LRTASARVGAVLHSTHGGNGRRYGASFCSRSETRDRRLRCVRRHPQHRLPSAVLNALRSAGAACVVAPVAAPAGTSGISRKPSVALQGRRYPWTMTARDAWLLVQLKRPSKRAAFGMTDRQLASAIAAQLQSSFRVAPTPLNRLSFMLGQVSAQPPYQVDLRPYLEGEVFGPLAPSGASDSIVRPHLRGQIRSEGDGSSPAFRIDQFATALATIVFSGLAVVNRHRDSRRVGALFCTPPGAVSDNRSTGCRVRFRMPGSRGGRPPCSRSSLGPQRHNGARPGSQASTDR